MQCKKLKVKHKQRNSYCLLGEEPISNGSRHVSGVNEHNNVSDSQEEFIIGICY